MTSVDTAKPTMRQRILDGASATLQRMPLAKMTMEDIAQASGIARQTIYRHFANRDEIVIALFIDEVLEHHRPILNDLHAKGMGHDELTALFLDQIDLALGWSLLGLTFTPNAAPWIAELVLGSEPMQQANRDLWIPILADYEKAGLLRPGLDLAEATRWLTYQAIWLLSHPGTLAKTDDDRRHYARTFMVGALLTDPDGPGDAQRPRR